MAVATTSGSEVTEKTARKMGKEKENTTEGAMGAMPRTWAQVPGARADRPPELLDGKAVRRPSAV